MHQQDQRTGTYRMRTLAAAVALCAVVMLSSAPLYAGAPMDMVKVSFDKALGLLNDSALKAPDMKQKRRDMLKEVASGMFDWEEMSKRAMGIYWKDRTPEEKKEFVNLFTDLLEHTYMDRIESYSGEKILYCGESVEGTYAMVQTKIITRQGVEIPVNYVLLARNGRWAVYDVSIEGVSLVRNYRSQINEIMTRSSYPELIKKLQEKKVASQVPAV